MKYFILGDFRHRAGSLICQGIFISSTFLIQATDFIYNISGIEFRCFLQEIAFFIYLYIDYVYGLHSGHKVY